MSDVCCSTVITWPLVLSEKNCFWKLRNWAWQSNHCLAEKWSKSNAFQMYFTVNLKLTVLFHVHNSTYPKVSNFDSSLHKSSCHWFPVQFCSSLAFGLIRSFLPIFEIRCVAKKVTPHPEFFHSGLEGLLLFTVFQPLKMDKDPRCLLWHPRVSHSWKGKVSCPLGKGPPLRMPEWGLSQSYYKRQISCMKYSAKSMSGEVKP